MKVKQYITELLVIFTTNKYTKTKLNKTKTFGNIKGRSRLVSQSVATYLVPRSDMDEFQSTQLVNSRLPRRTYLVTYSQANLTKFPTRKEFGKCIKKHFNSGSGKVKVRHWACAKEKKPKWRGTLSCCIEVDWSKTLEICERKHIIRGRNSG